MPKRKIIVNIATSADGYVARTNGNLDWLTRRPAPKGFYGLPRFSRSIDAKILGRKTFDLSLKMGASFSANEVHYVFSRRPPPASVPAGVQFVTESIRTFAERLRKQAGKNIWMMGGGEIIGSFLDEDAIDEFIMTVVPTFIGEGIPSLHRGIVRCRSGCYLCDDFRTALFNFTTTCSNRESEGSQTPNNRERSRHNCYVFAVRPLHLTSGRLLGH